MGWEARRKVGRITLVLLSFHFLMLTPPIDFGSTADFDLDF